MISRLPQPALRPFVARLWASGAGAGASPEHVLPTGRMHLVVRLDGPPIAIGDARGVATLGHAVIGGARATYYRKPGGATGAAVGAQLHPGAAALLFGASAGALAERHTPLADVWGRAAHELHARLAACATPTARLDELERVLAARLPRARGLHPAIAHALARLDAPALPAIATLVAESGLSHRAFTTRFRDEVGLAPKAFARVLRGRRATRALLADRRGLAELALACGYADQAHLTRELVALAGVTPARYRALAPAHPSHVAIR